MAAGTHEFSFDVEHKLLLLNSRKGEVKIKVEVPEKKPEAKAEPVKATDFDFQKLFVYPALTALVAAVLLAATFWPPPKRPDEKELADGAYSDVETPEEIPPAP
jgi:hypothetical protein